MQMQLPKAAENIGTRWVGYPAVPTIHWLAARLAVCEPEKSDHMQSFMLQLELHSKTPRDSKRTDFGY